MIRLGEFTSSSLSFFLSSPFPFFLTSLRDPFLFIPHLRFITEPYFYSSHSLIDSPQIKNPSTTSPSSSPRSQQLPLSALRLLGWPSDSSTRTCKRMLVSPTALSIFNRESSSRRDASPPLTSLLCSPLSCHSQLSHPSSPIPQRSIKELQRIQPCSFNHPRLFSLVPESNSELELASHP